ncbi:MAG TPA: hypothetical protein PK959_06610 [Candidatus Competibacteraceae bacterium]|nr:hypothetical protein [Candidatus Competibacteraceae bacterium]
MAITVADLKFFQAERMTDNEDGGGRMTGTEIVSGQDNQIFDDLSDVDRAAGDVSIRKAFAAVTSADTDKYLDAGVAMFREPTDENVSVLLFSTGDYYDERDALKTRLEQTISRGGRWNGWLWGQHLTGQRAVVIWQRPEASLIATGARLELVSKASGVEQYSQFLWITRVVDNLRTIYEAFGEQTIQYVVRELICELAEPLDYNFAGIEPSRGDPAVVTGTLLYDTRYNAEAVPLFGIQPTIEAASVSDFSIKIANLYSPLIPTALSETALPDVTPGGDSPALVGANTVVVQFSTTTESIKSGVSLYCGTGIMPGTLSISVSGATITDDNGSAMLSETEIGSVDYGNGLITWNGNCPNYSTASKTVTFMPAAKPLRVADTAAQIVTTSNRGYVWVLTLSPIPAPGTLRVAYQVNNVWYVLTEQGGGLIAGVDSSYGSGSLNFSTGTAMITTGALPDVNSMIIYSWGTPVNYTTRGGAAVDAPVVRGQTAHAGVAPGTVVVEWTVGVTTYTLDDDPAADGNLTGTGGVGFIRYATGEWWVRPTTVPPVATEFTIDYDYGTPTEETFAHPTRELDGSLLLTLNADPREHSVEVEWNLLVEDYEAAYSTEIEFIPPNGRSFDPIKIVRDNGAGALIISGGTNGTVNYVAGTVQWMPDVTVSIPKPLYSKHLLGSEVVAAGGGSSVTVNTYRTLFDGYEYIPAGAQYPSDESGYVKVRYRVVGGDSSASETVTLSQLELDVTKGYGETLVAGSTRFVLGGSTYVDIGGQLYRDPSPLTGAGTLSGTLDRSTGRARITAWTAGGANSVTLQALTTVLDGQPVEEVIFRAPINPLRAGTLQLRYQLLTGTTKTKTVDDSGLLSDSDCTIRVDYPLGIVRARFGLWKVDSELTPEEKLESWYDADARVTIGGVLKIWKPLPALADSIIYNAVAQTFLPPDSNLLGINAARLPVDGRALIFNTGRLVLVHHTDSITEQSLSPTQVIDCQRLRLYRAVIEDSLGARLAASQYTVDRAAGTVTMSQTLNLTGYTAPYTIQHTIADLVRLVAVDINGTLTLNKALSHAYPADDSRVSSLLYIGTLQARVSNLFAQATWTSVWQDTVIGTPPLCQYNDVQYPLVITNEGAYPDRFLVQFTSSTDFRVIGQNLGIIGIGNINQNCSPINSLTSQPYFTIDYRGWGSGWATGNCLRFNLIGACYPVDLIRATQPSEPTGTDDSIELLFVGNVDA